VDDPLKGLAKYASQRLLLHLERHPRPLDEPVSRSFAGAVLFADMQNFTILAERLNREDPVSGVKTLAHYLDIYIGRLVDIITDQGGDIVKFAGDAVFAIWEEQGVNGPAAAVVHAIRCGLKIQSLLHRYQVAQDTRLALRVGVGAGTLHELHLGGYLDRWEFLFAGRPMSESGRAGTLAEPGQVVLSPQAARLAQKAGYGQRIAGRRFQLIQNEVGPQVPLSRHQIPANAQDAFKVYIPRAVLVSNTGMQAELRPVTVLFCKLKGFKFPVDTSLATLQVIMLILQECIYRYEGSINRLGVDEKGAILLAAFGLPPLVHPDDPVRGVLAALDIRRALAVVGHDACVGVATGRAFCGTVGNDVRCEYTMHGVNVNLAARLMVTAETILCDENTRVAAGNRFKFEEQPPLRLKRLDGLIHTYRPV